MQENLIINGHNSYQTYKVTMGTGFIDAIEGSVPLKDFIENDSRLQHGSQIIVNKHLAKRTVTLPFHVFGSTVAAYQTNKKAFEALLYEGNVTMQIVGRTEVYKLIYTGKSVSYKHSYNGKFGILTLQFVEPNPADRT